jgi:hypothetical protein
MDSSGSTSPVPAAVGQFDLQQVADHRHRALVDQRGVFLELVVALLHGGAGC